MLPGVLEGGTVLYPLGWRRCPFCVPSIPYSAEKPHVFRKATKEVAFRNTCGFWAYKCALAHNGDKRETMHYNDVHYNDVEDLP